MGLRDEALREVRDLVLARLRWVIFGPDEVVQDLGDRLFALGHVPQLRVIRQRLLLLGGGQGLRPAAPDEAVPAREGPVVGLHFRPPPWGPDGPCPFSPPLPAVRGYSPT